MPELIILADLRRGSNYHTTLKREEMTDAFISCLGRLPHGMQSGNSSIAVYATLKEPLVLKDGRVIKTVFCETSLKLFFQAMPVFVAAEHVDSIVGGN